MPSRSLVRRSTSSPRRWIRERLAIYWTSSLVIFLALFVINFILKILTSNLKRYKGKLSQFGFNGLGDRRWFEVFGKADQIDPRLHQQAAARFIVDSLFKDQLRRRHFFEPGIAKDRIPVTRWTPVGYGTFAHGVEKTRPVELRDA